jgi:lipoate-protein ligase A
VKPTLFIWNQNSFRNPFYNLSIEESIALHLNDFSLDSCLRFWRNHNSAVIGISDSYTKNIPSHLISVFEDQFDELKKNYKLKEDSFYICRRASGGGTVFHDKEYNLNYSIFASSKQRPDIYPVKDSYKILLGLITKTLSKQNILSDQFGKSDLGIEVGGIIKKISGNAQFRKKDFVVQHGTLILNEKLLEKVSQTLNHPPEEPEYRQKRNHKEFLTSLPNRFKIQNFIDDLSKITSEEFNLERTETKNILFVKQVLKTAKILYKEKYASKEYIFRT